MAKQFSRTHRKPRCPAAIRLAWREHFSDEELDREYVRVANANTRVRKLFDVLVKLTLSDWLDLLVRACHCCEYCGGSGKQLVIDHLHSAHKWWRA